MLVKGGSEVFIVSLNLTRVIVVLYLILCCIRPYHIGSRLCLATETLWLRVIISVDLKPKNERNVLNSTCYLSPAATQMMHSHSSLVCYLIPPGDNVTNEITFVIQIRWKIRFAGIRFMVFWSLQHFKYATTAQLPYHVQNFVMIVLITYAWEQNELRYWIKIDTIFMKIHC